MPIMLGVRVVARVEQRERERRVEKMDKQLHKRAMFHADRNGCGRGKPGPVGLWASGEKGSYD